MSEKTTKTKNICIEEGCKKQASFNFEGLKKRLYCSKHKKKDMIDLKKKTCLQVECNKEPYFNFLGEIKGIYCAKHKKKDMINVISKTCLEEACLKCPHFNFKGESKGLYCYKHKKEDMIDVVHKNCLECGKKPSFNFKGESKGLYCAKHKKKDMINVQKKTCFECDKKPNFNFKGESKGLYCAKHKKKDMINVVNKTCFECDKTPNFNFLGETKGIYCAKHKKTGMIDVVHKTCKSEWCDTQVRNKKYEGYCLYCYINLFPDKPVSRNYKTKEFAVVEFVKAKFPHVDWIADKIINGGCSKKRPDLLLDLGYQILIIEIDENQHINYDCSCENKRIMELSQDMGHRPIVFIRFNPDSYIKDGKKISSCWGNNQKGICVIKKNKTKEWKDRLNSLEELIIYWLKPENKTNKVIETIELYYDI